MAPACNFLVGHSQLLFLTFCFCFLPLKNLCTISSYCPYFTFLIKTKRVGGCHFFLWSRGGIRKNFAPLKISSATFPRPSPAPVVYMMNAVLYKRLGSLATRISKQQYATASLDVFTRFFVHFFAVSTRLRRENALFSRFIKDVNKRPRNFLSLSELEHQPASKICLY